ncbi:MAG TPA: 30S ribosomal protein S4 [Candidatus Paceibacterota bacterium]|jgi:small subunit ribosomal protein S4|nr:30S ribosomal protein S4 [Candidatus Paceibacterota bacterium]HOQ15311.1 30S ribosomal protein S4 [Candidatus Paceibacterota bacterium]HPQ22855.1 30S ribosomal protein S4 [Candidatus Paceibacterota bacterium]
MKENSCKKCRYAGEKLFLKGEKCYTPKCLLVRKGYATRGKSGRRKSPTPYGKQLSEKQKVKLAYNIREEQFERYYELALKKKTATPEALAQILESRMDNIVFRLGFAPSRRASRQLVSHGHFLLNGRRHNIPSTILKVGDVITLRPESLKKESFKNIKEKLKNYQLPKFLTLDKEKLEGKIIAPIDLEELQLPFDFSLIVEFYSKK